MHNKIVRLDPIEYEKLDRATPNPTEYCSFIIDWANQYEFEIQHWNFYTYTSTILRVRFTEDVRGHLP